MLTRAATEHALPTHVSMAVDVSTKYGKKSVTARGLDSKEKGVERVRNKLNQEKNKGQKGRPPQYRPWDMWISIKLFSDAVKMEVCFPRCPQTYLDACKWT